MSQAKKTRYRIYPSALNKIVKQARRRMPPALTKRIDDHAILCRLLEEGEAGNGENTWMVLAEEFLWQQQESITLFPDETLLRNLATAHYTMDAQAGYTLPFESFILAVPDCFTIGGVNIPSVLVTWMTQHDRYEHAQAALSRHVGRTPKPYRGDSTGRWSLSITYRTADHTYARTLLAADDLPALLASRSIKAFKRQLGSIEGTSDLTGTDAAIQYHTLKLVGAIGIYNLATEGSKLADGYPGGTPPKIDGKTPDQRVRPFTLVNCIPRRPETEPRDVQDAYHRSWHFRQLRAPRYYQGNYEHHAAGSRYTLVSETVVGQRATPTTIT